MKKNLIIGAFSHYNFNQLKPWVVSINHIADHNTEKIILVGKSSKETVDELVLQGFKVIKMDDSIKKNNVYVFRFLAIYNYLKEDWRKYEWVVTTDVRDVIFQSSPFEWLNQKLRNSTYKIVASSESMLYKNEPWGNKNLLEAFGKDVHSTFKNHEIYNVGTIGGKSEYIKDLMFNIYTHSINRPIPIVDQAVFNIIIQTEPYKSCIFFAKQSDAWACQAATVADPSRKKQFKPFLLEKTPQFKNGKVLTPQGKVFVMVHQYDRVPAWKTYFEHYYEQTPETKTILKILRQYLRKIKHGLH
jgi:hypothetical protein